MAKNGFSMSNRVAVESVSASKTLTADDCGKHFAVTATGSGIDVILPSASLAGDGWNVRINIISGSVAKDVTVISSDGSNMNWFGVDAVGAGTNATAIQTLTFQSGSLATGDSLDVVNIDSSWYVRSFTGGPLDD